MKRIQHAISFAIAAVGLTALVLSAGAVQPLKIDFSDETVGAEPKSFISVVGVWRIETDGNNKVLVVDGRQWKEGQTAAGIADKARALYGERYADSWIVFRPTPISPMPRPRMSRISATETYPCGSKAFPAASIKARESSSI
jgi:hypothetical protein